MGKKAGPYVFLVSLLLVIFFAGGIKYGQKVEKDNQAIERRLSVTPVKPTPVPTAPLAFTTMVHSGCGISFVYPNNMETQNGSSQSAALSGDPGKISFDCSQTVLPTIDLQSPAEEVVINNTKYKAEKITDGENNLYRLNLRHPVTRRPLNIEVSERLWPLIQKSLELSR